MRWILSAVVPMLAMVTPAHAAPSALEALYACEPISDVGQRAACYDAATSKLKSAVKAGDVTIVDNADLQSLQKEVFGFQAPSLPAMLAKNSSAAPITTINAKIAKLRRGNETTFTLDNGQIWRQVDTTGNQSLREGASVRIERRIMGSYLLFPLDGGGAVRVSRTN